MFPFKATSDVFYHLQRYAQRILSSVRYTDWEQVKNASKLPVPLHGRHGMLANLDEAYDFLTSFGLLSGEDGGKVERKVCKINPFQSALNKLLQFGSAARATKTSGSYGEGDLRVGISLGVTSHIHPPTYRLPLCSDEGEILGVNGATCPATPRLARRFPTPSRCL